MSLCYSQANTHTGNHAKQICKRTGHCHRPAEEWVRSEAKLPGCDLISVVWHSLQWSCKSWQHQAQCRKQFMSSRHINAGDDCAHAGRPPEAQEQLQQVYQVPQEQGVHIPDGICSQVGLQLLVVVACTDTQPWQWRTLLSFWGRALAALDSHTEPLASRRILRDPGESCPSKGPAMKLCPWPYHSYGRGVPWPQSASGCRVSALPAALDCPATCSRVPPAASPAVRSPMLEELVHSLGMGCLNAWCAPSGMPSDGAQTCSSGRCLTTW